MCYKDRGDKFHILVAEFSFLLPMRCFHDTGVWIGLKLIRGFTSMAMSMSFSRS